MTRIVDFLGRAVEELLAVPPFAEWHSVRTVGSEPRNEIRYNFEGRGVEVICDEFERIQTVFVHRDGEGESLIDVSFAMRRDQILKRFGMPTESGGATRIAVLGDYGAWDRFALSEGTLHVQYAFERDEIELVAMFIASVMP